MKTIYLRRRNNLLPQQHQFCLFPLQVFRLKHTKINQYSSFRMHITVTKTCEQIDFNLNSNLISVFLGNKKTYTEKSRE